MISKQRAARFLLWGGFALFIAGLASCGVGCIGAADSAFNQNPESESIASGGIGASFHMVVISIVMVFVGSILKAISGKSREQI